MYIGLFAPYFDATGYPGRRLPVWVAQALQRAGHHVNFHFANSAPNSPDLGFEVTRWPRPEKFGRRSVEFHSSIWARRLFEKSHFDATLSFSSFVPGRVMVLMHGRYEDELFPCRPGVPSVEGLPQRLLHRARHDEPTAALQRLESEALGHKLTQTIIAPSTNLYETVMDDLVPRLPQLRKVDFLPPTVEAITQSDAGDQYQVARQRWRARLKIQPQDLAVLIPVEHEEADRPQWLVQALALCPPEMQQRLMLIFAGKVSYKVQKFAQELGLRQRVRFVGQTSQWEALAALADAACWATRRPGWPGAMLWLAQRGLPLIVPGQVRSSCLACTTGDASEAIWPRIYPVNPAKKPQAWADALVAICDDQKSQLPVTPNYPQSIDFISFTDFIGMVESALTGQAGKRDTSRSNVAPSKQVP